MDDQGSANVTVGISKFGSNDSKLDPRIVAMWLHAQADWIVEHWDELAREVRLSMWAESDWSGNAEADEEDCEEA